MDRLEHEDVAGCLRAWRDRLTPEAAGLPSGAQRRAPGLRREEVAQLAGLSVDYLARLEQGRARNPSASVLAPLARALRLTDDERAHLFRLAGHAEPVAGGRIPTHLTPGVQRVLDRLSDVPVLVLDATWQVIAMNRLGTALIGDFAAAPPLERNIAWRHFAGLPSRVLLDEQDAAAFERAIVADLRDAHGRYPDDRRLPELIAELRRVSPRFFELCERHEVGARVAARKTIRHPEIGELTLDCDTLTVAGSDLRLVVYTAEPGSEDARALALLGAVGTQSFAGG